MISQTLSELRQQYRSENLLGMSVACRDLLKRKPSLGAAWAEVATLARDSGDYMSEHRAAMHLLDALPEAKEAWMWLATAEHDLGRYDDALKILKSMLARIQDDPVLFRRTGRVLLDMGDRQTAADQFIAALSIIANDVLAWEGLSLSKDFRFGDEHFPTMEELRLNFDQSVSAEQRGILSYSIANVYEHLEEYEISSSRVWEASSFIRESKPFDIETHEASIDRMLDAYDPDFIDSQSEAGLIDSRPVFLIAPPAAGATWLGHVLSASAEMSLLPRTNALFWMATTPLGDQTEPQLKRALQQAGPDGVLAEIGRTYVDYATEITGQNNKWIDTSSLMEMAAGSAGLTLPSAKFIIIQRDYRDLAWAVFKRRFREGRFWTYHLDDIARVLKVHQTLVERWQSIFPDRVLVTRYEDLAENTEHEVRRIAEFAGADVQASLAQATASTDIFTRDPVGIHVRAASRLDTLDSALERAGLL